MLKFLFILFIIGLVILIVVSLAIKGIQRYLAKLFYGNKSSASINRNYNDANAPGSSDVIYNNGKTVVMKGEAGKKKDKTSNGKE